jgi:hypothetical protein
MGQTRAARIGMISVPDTTSRQARRIMTVHSNASSDNFAL